MSLDSLCNLRGFQVSLYCAWRIPVHLRCTQCSILLHLMDICLLLCICLWHISQIQTCFVWLSDLDLSRHHPLLRGAAPFIQRVRMAGLLKNSKSGPNFWGAGGFDTILTAVCNRCDSFTTCRLCRLGPRK